MEMSERPTAVMEMDENAKGHRPRSRVERLGHQLRTLWRRPVHLWRASLGFRVVVATMLLGILVLTAVGTYLYGSIAQGLVDGRQSIAAVDSQRDAKDTQNYFQYTDKVDSTADVGQGATDQIRSLQRDSGTEERYVVRTGDTLWSLAAERYGGDPREGVWRIRERNGLQGGALQAGIILYLPAGAGGA